MANTYTSLFYHIVFSTKNRVAFIRPDIEERVWAYISGIARNHKMTALQIGGIEDHLHALVMAPPAIAPYEIAKYLKGESSKWIHETFADLRDFGWQDGYGAFTVRHAPRGLKPTAKLTPSLRDEDNAHAASNQALKRTLEFIDSILGGETK